MRPPRRPVARRGGLGLLVLAALAVSSPPPAAGAVRPWFAQTVRRLRAGDEAGGGDYWISYTSATVRGSAWSLRGSVSWLEREGGEFPDRSGWGAVYLTAGRRLWSSRSADGPTITGGWVRVRGKLPLRDEASALGSGEADWGAGLAASVRHRRLLLFAEAGYLDLGEPAGVDYRGLLTGSVTASLHPRSLPFYPVVGVLAASPSSEGEPAYAELSAGVGFRALGRATLTILGSAGLTGASPEAGASVTLGLGP
jgi:hypothetical protein